VWRLRASSMGSSSSPAHLHGLPEDVVVSVRGVTRAIAAPEPELPRWLARMLPKSGLAGGVVGPEIDDEELDDDLEMDEEEEPATLREISFDVRGGEGLGILGADGKARRTLMRILAGAIPPSTGTVVVRGRMVPVLRRDLSRLALAETGKEAVYVAARFLHWPRSTLRSRWDEILDLAKLDELAHLPHRKYVERSRTRLLVSAALHVDASVYLVDESIASDHDLAARCFDLLERRQREGAGVIQVGNVRIENLARLCNEVLWLEDGRVAHRGRPLDVAMAVTEAHVERVNPFSVPVTATLSGPGESVDVPPEGGTVDFELEVLRGNLDMVFSLQLVDGAGRAFQLEQPQNVRSKGPGRYLLRIFIPGGLFPDGTYEGKLIVDMGANAGEAARRRELLTFEVVSTWQEELDSGDDGPTFELLPDADDVPTGPADVEWRASRSSS
jgi:ABC-2 type transport system ATP-binding protein